MSANILDPQRIKSALRMVVVCYSWLALTPCAIWLAANNVMNLWVSVPAVTFSALATLPLLVSWAVWSEYSDARKGIHSFD